MWFRNRFRIASVVVLFLIVSISVSACDAIQSNPPPNVIIILTDDMDLSLMPFLENTNALIAKNGATFTNYFATSSLCCPSRASMLRGQYPHNTNVLSNNFPIGGFRRFFVDGSESETLAVWLNREGYQTSLIGKYLNGYPVFAGSNYVPAGWTDWHALFAKKQNEKGNFYNNYTLNENGPLVKYGNSAEEYSTDVFNERSMQFIDQSVADGDPFFLLLSVYAPHGPSKSAPRHTEMLADLTYPQKPSFNEEDVSDKPEIIQALASTGNEIDGGDADYLYQQRARTLLAVDELVVDVIRKLEQNGQLENTYIFFTSDNGLHIGEHRLATGKGLPYEEDIHVPLLVRGPGIMPNTVITQLVANIDLAPTITEITGVDAADFVDGRSLVPLFQTETSQSLDWRKGLLFEMGGLDNSTSSSVPGLAVVNSASLPYEFEYPDSANDSYLLQVGDSAYIGIRTEKFKYIEYNNGETEFYDLIADPYELENLASKLDAAILSSLHTWLGQLQTCTTQDCRNFESKIPNGLENYP
jgi:arylsulfatase A-like enzyme